MITHPALIRNIPQSKKQKLFHFLHILLRQYKISSYFVSILIILQTLQMIYFAIHPTCCKIWQFNGFHIIQQILGYISGILLWNDNIITCFVSCTICMCIYGIGIAIVIYQIIYGGTNTGSITTTIHQLRVKFMQYLAMLTRTILIIPIISLQITTILQNYNNNNATVINIITLVFAIISFIFVIILLYLFLQLFIDNSPFSKFSLAGPITSIEKHKTYCKIVMALLCSILPQTCQQSTYVPYLIFLILFILCFMYLAYMYYVYPNLVYHNVRFVQENSIVVLLFLYLMILVQKLLGTTNGVSAVWTVIICVFGCFGWAKLKMRRQNMLLFSYYKSLSSKGQILAYNYLFYQCIRDFNKSPLCLVKLLGILNDHVLTCNKLDQVCKCRIMKQKVTNFGYSQDSQFNPQQKRLWFQFIKSNLLYNTQKMSHLPQFHLLLSYIENKSLSNNFLAYSNLQKCSLKKSSLVIDFLIYNQKIIIERVLYEQDIKNNQKKQIDVNKFLQMTELVTQFQQIVLKSSLEHLDFWTALSKKNKKNKLRITNQGNNLMATVRLCQQKYKILTQKYPQNLSSIVLYSNYAKYILNNQQIILKNKSLFNLIKKKLCRQIKIASQQQKQKYSQNALTGTIVISGQRNNIGIIKCCSSKVTKIIKYAPYQLVGQNINLLMPSFIGNMHNQVLFKYLELSDPQTNFVQRCVPMIDKNNFMILCKMMTKPMPSLINGMELIGIFQRIKQQNVRHMSQSPKYLLYRCDIGNVQALSQNFYTYYGYRLMKVNQYSEISQQLNFNNLFNNVYDADLKSSQSGIQCDLKLKRGDKRTMRVQVYVRLQIIYFGTKVKLISIFNTSQGTYNTLALQNSMNPATQIAISQNSSNDQKSKQVNQIKNQNNQANKNSVQTLNQQQLKQLKTKIPVKFRFFQILLLILLIAIIMIACVQLIFNVKRVSIVHDLLEHTQYVSNSLLYLVNIGYYSRMMHMSTIYPQNIINFKQSQSNISALTNTLQTSQFWLVNKQVELNSSINFNFNTQPLIWIINQKQQISSKKQSLNLNIFDIVTSSSSFNGAIPSNFNFGTKLMQNKINAANNSYFRNLFTIRYSTIFQLIAAKQKYESQLFQAYSLKLDGYYKNNFIDIGIALGIIVVLLIIMLKLLHILLRSILSIKSLFNWLASSQIQKQVQKCETFIQHFFKHCYQVVLRLNKNQILRGYSFDQTQAQPGKKAPIKFMSSSPNYPEATQQFQDNYNEQQFLCQNIQNNMQQTQQIDLIKVSQKKIKNKQKEKEKKKTIQRTIQKSVSQKKQLTQKQLNKSQHDPNNSNNNPYKKSNNNPNNTQKIQINKQKITQKQKQKTQNFGDEITPLKNQQQQQIDIEDNQIENGLDIQNINIFIPILICCIFAILHYISIFLYIQTSHSNTLTQLNAHKLLHKNLQSFDILNYYSLQYNIDPQTFASYINPNNLQSLYFNETQQLYKLQQQLYKFSDSDNALYKLQKLITTFNIGGICYIDDGIYGYKQTVMYQNNSYNIQQCQSIDHGILKQGMRPSIVAYIENIKNITINISIQKYLNSTSFSIIQNIRKYIHSAMTYLLQQSTNTIQTDIKIQKIIIIIWSCLLITFIVIIGIVINIKTSRILDNKILGVYQIVSLIPKRVFQRNNNLCVEYRKNVDQLLK